MKIKFSTLAHLFIFLSPSICFGYIDPGSGSILFQMLIAGLIGFFFTIKIYFQNFKNYIAKFFNKNTEQANTNNIQPSKEDNQTL